MEKSITKKNHINHIAESRHQSGKIQQLSKITSHHSLGVQVHEELDICNIIGWAETRKARY